MGKRKKDDIDSKLPSMAALNNNNNNNNNEENKNRKKNKKRDSSSFAAHKKIVTDPRFASLHTDPRFQPISKKKSKLQVDGRFSRLLNDPSFSSSSSLVDKRGKPRKNSDRNHENNPLSQYYDLEQIEEDPDSKEEGVEGFGSFANEGNGEGERKVKERKRLKKLEKKKSRKGDNGLSTVEEEEEEEEEGEDDFAFDDSEREDDYDKSNGKLDKKKNKGKRKKKKKKIEEEEEEKDEILMGNDDHGRMIDEDDSEDEEEGDPDRRFEFSGSEEGFSEEDDDFSSSDASTSDIEEEDELQENLPMVKEATRRLAVVNMDWDYVKAADLYVLLRSFLPEGGQILSIAIYPSEFGLKSMAEEALHGPTNIFASDDEGDDSDGAEIDEAKLRAYEKGKLRYYYAVVEFNSSATADHVYKECDGVEYERTANILDLRFIPDSMQFEHPPHEIIKEPPVNYEFKDFHTRALQQSKINLSWDDDEPRMRTLRRKLNKDELDEMEFKDFLASDDDDDDDDVANETQDADASDHSRNHRSGKPKKLDKFQALLECGNDSGDSKEDVDLEMTFNTDLEDLSKRVLEKENKGSETVWDAYLRKRREKKKDRKMDRKALSEDDSDSDEENPEEMGDFFADEVQDGDEGIGPIGDDDISHKGKKGKSKNKDKKSKLPSKDAKQDVASKMELELLLAGKDETGNKGYNLKSKKKGTKKEVLSDDELPDVDYNDPRFSALFTSHLYALDPTDPQYKRSAAYAREVALKHKKKDGTFDEDRPSDLVPEATTQMKHDEVETKDKSAKAEKLKLMALVKSVKRKAGSLGVGKLD